MTSTRNISDQGKKGRGGRGRYIRTDESAARDAEACRLRTDGATYQRIADELGYADPSAAWKAVDRALRAIVAEPASRLKSMELARLDVGLVEVFRILRADHVVVSNGRVVMDPADPSKPLLDDGPKLQAIDRLIKIAERRARYCGLDMPTKVEAITVDAVEAEIARLAVELGVNDRLEAQR